MSYKYVQFIGHAICTGPKQTSQGWRYLGNVDDENADIHDRLNLVAHAIDTARNASSIATGNDTLKVYVMPEFFFRGGEGAYVHDRLFDVVTGLQQLVKDPKWKDWIFFFGTALGRSIPQVLSSLKLPTDKSKLFRICHQGYNFVPCVLGGFGSGDPAHSSWTVVKAFQSGIDYLPLNPNAGFGSADLTAPPFLPIELMSNLDDLMDKHPPETKPKNINYGGEGIFDAATFKWGVEVCLDHAVGRLRRSQNLPKLNFHIIPSAGMSIQPGSVALSDGWVFNVDGLNAGPADIATTPGPQNASHTSLQKWKGGAASAEGTACGKVPVTGVDVDRLYALGAGQLHIYDRVAATV